MSSSSGLTHDSESNLEGLDEEEFFEFDEDESELPSSHDLLKNRKYDPMRISDASLSQDRADSLNFSAYVRSIYEEETTEKQEFRLKNTDFQEETVYIKKQLFLDYFMPFFSYLPEQDRTYFVENFIQRNAQKVIDLVELACWIHRQFLVNSFLEGSQLYGFALDMSCLRNAAVKEQHIKQIRNKANHLVDQLLLCSGIFTEEGEIKVAEELHAEAMKVLQKVFHKFGEQNVKTAQGLFDLSLIQLKHAEIVPEKFAKAQSTFAKSVKLTKEYATQTAAGTDPAKIPATGDRKDLFYDVHQVKIPRTAAEANLNLVLASWSSAFGLKSARLEPFVAEKHLQTAYALDASVGKPNAENTALDLENLASHQAQLHRISQNPRLLAKYQQEEIQKEIGRKPEEVFSWLLQAIKNAKMSVELSPSNENKSLLYRLLLENRDLDDAEKVCREIENPTVEVLVDLTKILKEKLKTLKRKETKEVVNSQIFRKFEGNIKKMMSELEKENFARTNEEDNIILNNDKDKFLELIDENVEETQVSEEEKEQEQLTYEVEIQIVTAYEEVLGFLSRLNDANSLQTGKVLLELALFQLDSRKKRKQSLAEKIEGLDGIRELLEESVRIHKEGDEVDLESLSTAEIALGRTLMAYGSSEKIEEGKNILETAYEQRKRSFGMKDPKTLEAMKLLASCCSTLDLFVEGIELYEEVLGYDRQIYKTPSKEVATDLYNLANCQTNLFQYSSASENLRECIQIRTVVKEYSGLAGALNSLAIILKNQGHLTEASEAFANCLNICPKNHVDRALFRFNFAELLHTQGKNELAKNTYMQVLKFWRENLVPGDPKIASLLSALAKIQTEEKDMEQAIKTQEEALEIDKAFFGEKSLVVAKDLTTLGKIQLTFGMFKESELNLKKALELKEAKVGTKHVHTALGLEALALLYRAQGDFEKAVKLGQDSFKILEELLGKHHIWTEAAKKLWF
eukprot:augustus_masked-scaffold_32-processed-gene-1.4-mRNA-1 protein AED:1.00 eAED:1.00 QI:0/-1/0/0/-1/1/1/0/968